MSLADYTRKVPTDKIRELTEFYFRGSGVAREKRNKRDTSVSNVQIYLTSRTLVVLLRSFR